MSKKLNDMTISELREYKPEIGERWGFIKDTASLLELCCYSKGIWKAEKGTGEWELDENNFPLNFIHVKRL